MTLRVLVLYTLENGTTLHLLRTFVTLSLGNFSLTWYLLLVRLKVSNFVQGCIFLQARLITTKFHTGIEVLWQVHRVYSGISRLVYLMPSINRTRTSWLSCNWTLIGKLSKRSVCLCTPHHVSIFVFFFSTYNNSCMLNNVNR